MNYLGAKEDQQPLIEAVKKTRKIFSAPLLDEFRDEELLPGDSVQTDDEILDYIRREAISVFHPVGTCKMGHDELAVVDERLRVQGVRGLRIADASIMPTILSGNTHAACVAIAEKCADMLFEDHGKF